MATTESERITMTFNTTNCADNQPDVPAGFFLFTDDACYGDAVWLRGQCPRNAWFIFGVRTDGTIRDVGCLGEKLGLQLTKELRPIFTEEKGTNE